jgi:hypothetical protein
MTIKNMILEAREEQLIFCLPNTNSSWPIQQLQNKQLTQGVQEVNN